MCAVHCFRSKFFGIFRKENFVSYGKDIASRTVHINLIESKKCLACDIDYSRELNVIVLEKKLPSILIEIVVAFFKGDNKLKSMASYCLATVEV